MSKADEVLKTFEAAGNVVEPDQKKESLSRPTIKLHNKNGNKTELFVVGKLLTVKKVERMTPKGKRAYMFVDIVLEQTNTKASVKDDKAPTGYRDVEVKAGDIVTLFAASRLYNAALRLVPGAKLYAKYDGGEIEDGKVIHRHIIKALPGTLTAEEAEYVARANERKEAAIAAAQSKAEDEAEAEHAMSQLED